MTFSGDEFDPNPTGLFQDTKDLIPCLGLIGVLLINDTFLLAAIYFNFVVVIVFIFTFSIIHNLKLLVEMDSFIN